MASNYCRKYTKGRTFSVPFWKSKSELYDCYVKRCEQDGIRPFCTTVFLSIFKRKKDECELCIGYGGNNVNEKVYKEHLILKEEARFT